ncbi:hypothetical protein JL722_15235 [Aureococcus anophagefferens]|nr:hypothetical protein JL722_15235 [Aureococcus anophagefferens]
MEQLDASTLARWAAEPALYETPGKLETANDDWQRGVLRLSASGVVFCDDGRAARGMALDSVVRVTVGERKRFLKKARLTVELQGAAGTCAFDARDAFRRDALRGSVAAANGTVPQLPAANYAGIGYDILQGIRSPTGSTRLPGGRARRGELRAGAQDAGRQVGDPDNTEAVMASACDIQSGGSQRLVTGDVAGDDVAERQRPDAVWITKTSRTESASSPGDAAHVTSE